MAYKAISDLQLNYLVSKIVAGLGTKVDKIDGMGLSTNDFTNALKSKLDGIETGAEVNQNAFSFVKVDGTNVSAGTKTDTVSFVGGTNVTITPNADEKSITFTAKDTTYTFATGTANGTINVTEAGGAVQSIAVHGLGSAAYTNSTAYDAAGAADAVLGTTADTSAAATVYGAKKAAAEALAAAEAAQDTADTMMPIAGGTFTGPVTLNAAPTEDLQAATKKYVDDAKASAISTASNDATTKADAALDAAKKYADEKTANLSGAMHFEGKKDSIPTDNTGYEAGDVILVGQKEYVLDTTGAWVELGDEGSYALKTTTINGHALTGNITLTPTDIGADPKDTAKNLVEALDYTYTGSGNYVTNVTQTDGKIAIEKGTLPTALKNPNALTFGSKTYDGSSAATITAEDLGAVTDISMKQDNLDWVTNADIDAMFAGTYTA